MSLVQSTIWDYARRAASPPPKTANELYCRAFEQLRDIVRRHLTAEERETLHHAAQAEFRRLTKETPHGSI